MLTVSVLTVSPVGFIQGKNGAQGQRPRAPLRGEQLLADPRGVERLVDQSAAEEEQLPDLDSA